MQKSKSHIATEQDSLYDRIEEKSVAEIIADINQEDEKVANAVSKVLPEVQQLIEAIIPRMQNGGRIFYFGAGTSGRLGILDASECPPTFGVDQNLFIGLIAGGDSAIRKAVEFAEDDFEQAWKDFENEDIKKNDTIIGIAASGRTPYVIGGLRAGKAKGILTACITCNPGSEIGAVADHAIEVSTGPEYITGSTRMKSGTAQKMILNMLSTALMIKLGRIKGNKMVDMQLANNKLVDRGQRMLMETLQINQSEAAELLIKYGNVRRAIDGYNA
jgi:N-acetylmuramic acid 6-phosphate etherase